MTALVLKSSPLELSRVPPGNCPITLIPDLNEEHAQQCQLLIEENSSYYLEVIAIMRSQVI